MRHFHLQRNHYHCPIVNLDKLWSLVGEDVSRDRQPCGPCRVHEGQHAWDGALAPGWQAACYWRKQHLHAACMQLLMTVWRNCGSGSSAIANWSQRCSGTSHPPYLHTGPREGRQGHLRGPRH